MGGGAVGFGFVDGVVLVAYLLGITALGVWVTGRVRNIREFFMPRRFGVGMMIMHTFGTGTHSDQAVAVASKTYTNGLSGIWYQWLWLFATPFYWLIAPLMRRFRATTTADVFELRYSRGVAMLFAAVGTFQLTFNIGLMLKGSGAVIAAASGGAVPQGVAIAAMTVLFVIYGVAGGLGAAIVTDYAQGLLTILFSFLLLPFIMHAVGGMEGIRASVADPHLLSLVAPGEIGVFYITVIAFNGLVGIVTQPHTMGNCAAGRTELEGRIGFMFGSFIKRICTVAWCLTGLAAVVYYAGRPVVPDEVYGTVAREFLPRALPGLLGLFLAALLASVMSSCDSFMVATAGLFTANIYRPLRPGREEAHYLKVARWSSVAVVAGGLGFAYWLPDVVSGLEIFWKIAPMMGIAFWLGLYWRGATVAGAWASTLTAFFTWWLTTRAGFIAWLAALPGDEAWRLTFVQDGKTEVYLPWQMVFYLVAGTVAGVVVSWLTPKVPEERLERYYGLLRTPVREDEASDEPCTLPAGVEPPPRRGLLAGSAFELNLPDRVAVAGFCGGWVVVLAIIGYVYWLVGG